MGFNPTAGFSRPAKGGARHRAGHLTTRTETAVSIGVLLAHVCRLGDSSDVFLRRLRIVRRGRLKPRPTLGFLYILAS
jgi:hypothetical protein